MSSIGGTILMYTLAVISVSLLYVAYFGYKNRTLRLSVGLNLLSTVIVLVLFFPLAKSLDEKSYFQEVVNQIIVEEVVQEYNRKHILHPIDPKKVTPFLLLEIMGSCHVPDWRERGKCGR